MKTVYVVRHGEVENPEGILYGRIPGYGLSKLGREHALNASAWLADKPVSHIRVSPLQRAKETVEPIAKLFKLTPVVDDNLIEASNKFEGLKVSIGDGALRSPKHWPKLWNPFLPSWGEPYHHIVRRMNGGVKSALHNIESGQAAVIVSHQLCIWELRLALENKKLWHDPRKRQCSLGSITILNFDNNDKLLGIDYEEPSGTSDAKKVGA